MPGFTQTFCMSMTIRAVRAGSSFSIACSLPPRRFVTRATMSGDSAILCIWGIGAFLIGVSGKWNVPRDHARLQGPNIENKTMKQLWTVAALFALAVSPAGAQNAYPSKPITMVVPFGAGGALDLIARVLADRLRNALGQPVIVDNKPGASGLLAMRLAAGAAPDGYTIILSSESNHVLLPLLDKNFPMDVGKEFLPVSLCGQFQHTLIV